MIIKMSEFFFCSSSSTSLDYYLRNSYTWTKPVHWFCALQQKGIPMVKPPLVTNGHQWPTRTWWYQTDGMNDSSNPVIPWNSIAYVYVYVVLVVYIVVVVPRPLLDYHSCHCHCH